jgi:hypothetical protein
MKYPAIRKPNIPLAPIVKGLGWFSLGLGLAELLAPRQLSRGAGIRQNKSLLQGYGLREIVTGLGILLSQNPRPWIWGRVAGDVLDVATVAATADPKKPARLGISTLALLGAGLTDLYAALASAPKPPRTSAFTGTKDYRSRSGFPRPAAQMRGAALKRDQSASPQKMRAAE